MSLKQVHSEQPKEFKFTDENLKKAEEILKKYPKKNKKKAPKGYHYMPDGRLMKDSDHGKKKKSRKR